MTKYREEKDIDVGEGYRRLTEDEVENGRQEGDEFLGGVYWLSTCVDGPPVRGSVYRRKLPTPKVEEVDVGAGYRRLTKEEVEHDRREGDEYCRYDGQWRPTHLSEKPSPFSVYRRKLPAPSVTVDDIDFSPKPWRVVHTHGHATLNHGDVVAYTETPNEGSRLLYRLADATLHTIDGIGVQLVHLEEVEA